MLRNNKAQLIQLNRVWWLKFFKNSVKKLKLNIELRLMANKQIVQFAYRIISH